MDKPIDVIIDTDPGIDDAMAMLFLRARTDVRIRAITTVFGNADVETTTRNAWYLAERFGIDAPIAQGASRPVIGAALPAPVHVHGAGGLGSHVHSTSARHSEGAPAHEVIVQQIREAPKRVSILALGPLTNLALALRQDPGITSLVRNVVVMGGAFGWYGRRGNVSPVAEANIRNDPHAADEVFAADWPVTVVGLDVTTRCVLTTDRARSLAENGGEAGRFLWDISRAYERLYIEHDGLEGCCLHDVAAAVCLVQPGLFGMSKGPIRVVRDGIAIGQTIQHSGTQTFSQSEWDKVPPQNACQTVDAEGVVDLYTRTLIDNAKA